MLRRARLTLGALLAASLAGAAPLQALQAQPAQQSLVGIEDLLRRALDALNNLTYDRADSLAREVFAQGRRATESQRAIAYLMIAAAAYPEDRSKQRRSAALATLRDVVRTNPDVAVPADLTWPGLDSLVLEAKRTTFGARVETDSVLTVTGPSNALLIRVFVSRPAMLEIVVAPGAGGPPLRGDTVAIVESGEVALFAVRGNQPQFPSGEYLVTVTAHDRDTADSVRYTYRADVVSEPLKLLPLPGGPDSSRLLPERTPRGTAIGPAIAIGASLAAFSIVRGGGNIPAQVKVDAKGIGLTSALLAAIVTIGKRDAGRPLPDNVAANRAYVAAHRRYVSEIRGENRRRLDSHRTTFRLTLLRTP